MPTGPAQSAVRQERDQELAGPGWTRRFTAAPPRLNELRELYATLGYEVMLDPLLPGELADECEGCTLALSLFRMIYTRAPASGPRPSPPASTTQELP